MSVNESSVKHSPGDGRTVTNAAHSWAADIGPGIISTAADNDPSGIVTYSLAGARFGFDMLWVCVLSYPTIVALQLVSARIALLTGKGLTTNMREHYARLWLFLAVGRFLIANTFNVCADVVAMGVGAKLLWHGSVPGFAALFLTLSIALQWFVPYVKYARGLRWLAVSLFAYVAVIVVLPLPWMSLVEKAVTPGVVWSSHYLQMLMAILGTTISPYLLYSQAEQQVETERPAAQRKDRPSPRVARRPAWKRVCVDTLLRTALSNTVALSIMIAAAATLHAGSGSASTPATLAGALQPLAGDWAPHLLGLALISSALLALPPLAGSAARAVASGFGWPNDRPHDRHVAMTVMGICAVGGMAGVTLAAMDVNPLQLLYWSAVINGTTATPVMVLLVLLSTKHSSLGDLSAHWTLRALAWLATAGMGGAVAAFYLCKWFE